MCTNVCFYSLDTGSLVMKLLQNERKIFLSFVCPLHCDRGTIIFTSLSIILISEHTMSSWKNLDQSMQSDLLCLLHFFSFMQFHNKQAHALICSNYGNFRSSLSKAEHTIKCLKCGQDQRLQNMFNFLSVSLSLERSKRVM